MKFEKKNIMPKSGQEKESYFVHLKKCTDFALNIYFMFTNIEKFNNLLNLGNLKMREVHCSQSWFTKSLFCDGELKILLQLNMSYQIKLTCADENKIQNQFQLTRIVWIWQRSHRDFQFELQKDSLECLPTTLIQY